MYGRNFYLEALEPGAIAIREEQGSAGATQQTPVRQQAPDQPVTAEQHQQPDPASMTTLEEFEDGIRDCRVCRLAEGRKHVVFGVGNAGARLMCIGEAPGFEEDVQGEPFVGAAGKLLNKILAAIGFERAEVYIANIIKCRPPNNRTPEADEIASCLPYLRRQIELIQPKIILALGQVAAQSLLNSQQSVSALRSQDHFYSEIPVFVTYHPAALLRNQQLKRKTWEDVKRLRQAYDKLIGDKPEIELA